MAGVDVPHSTIRYLPQPVDVAQRHERCRTDVGLWHHLQGSRIRQRNQTTQPNFPVNTIPNLPVNHVWVPAVTGTMPTDWLDAVCTKGSLNDLGPLAGSRFSETCMPLGATSNGSKISIDDYSSESLLRNRITQINEGEIAVGLPYDQNYVLFCSLDGSARQLLPQQAFGFNLVPIK
jgi:hypothetical protein